MRGRVSLAAKPGPPAINRPRWPYDHRHSLRAALGGRTHRGSSRRHVHPMCAVSARGDGTASYTPRMARVWQIAAGERARGYCDLFVGHDLMLIGPGDPDPVGEGKYLGSGTSVESQVVAFAQRSAPGDLVLHRLGQEVHAVGTIRSGHWTRRQCCRPDPKTSLEACLQP